MRNLTIKRRKSFAGFMGKAYVWLRDEQNAEASINYVPCRKLGELKNGEEKTFSICEDEARILVSTSKTMTDAQHVDSFTIKPGTSDVQLTGCCTYDPQNGNPFRFDK